MSRKTADQRRADALEAARRLIGRDGVAHASVRNVAREAGMSTGSLRHIFPSHEDLFAALLDDGPHRARARIEAVVAQAAGRSAVDLATDILLEVTPTRPDTRLEALSQFAVLLAHPDNPEITRARLAAGRGLDELCRLVAGFSGEPDLADPGELRLIIDGLALRLLERPDTPESEVRARLGAVLRRMGLSSEYPPAGSPQDP